MKEFDIEEVRDVLRVYLRESGVSREEFIKFVNSGRVGCATAIAMLGGACIALYGSAMAIPDEVTTNHILEGL